MFVKVVASQSGNKFQHHIQHFPPSVIPRSTSGSFGGTPSSTDTSTKKRSVVSSSSQIKFTALAQMAEQRARAAVGATSAGSIADGNKVEDNATTELLPPPTTLQKSQSMQSLRAGVRKVRRKSKSDDKKLDFNQTLKKITAASLCFFFFVAWRAMAFLIG